MKNEVFIDDSKVEKAPYEIESSFQKNAESFFENEIKRNLKNPVIYSDESIAFLDKFIKSKVRKGSSNTKLLYSFLIGSYLGQYVVSKFKGNWVIDHAVDFKSFMDCFVRYTKESDLYFKPFACSINRIYWGKNDPIMSEIEVIKKTISTDKNWVKNLSRHLSNRIDPSPEREVL